MPGLPEGFETRLLASVASGAAPGGGARLPPGAVTHTLEAGGKRVRASLVHHFGAIAGAPADAVLELALAVEFLHAATLVHDDLIDRAAERRGRPSLVARFGEQVAVLVGDLYVARCGAHLAASGSSPASALVWEALDIMVRGELDQRERRFDLGQTEADYEATVYRKTGSLLRASCAAAVVLGSGNQRWRDAAADFGAHLGLCFQLVDDVLDYVGDPALMGKPVGGDIREGTVTLPLILALQASPGPIAALVESARESDDFSRVVDAVRDTGVVARCRDRARREADLAAGALEIFPAGEDREALTALARSMPGRSA